MPPSPKIAKSNRCCVQGLRDAVRSKVGKYYRKRKRDGCSEQQQRMAALNGALDHMEHCIEVLTAQIESFDACLGCLRNNLWPDLTKRIHRLKSRVEKDRKRELLCILPHLFLQVVRLRDGKVLLESGECRHSGDVAIAKKSKYRSQLCTGGNRSSEDGYTCLYNRNLTYSGASWDEFNDGAAGLRERLLTELRPLVSPARRDTLWDDLMEKAGSMENMVDQISTNLQQAQQNLKEFTDQLETELRINLVKVYSGSNVSVRLQLQDKTEKLQVSVGSAFQCNLERRASDVQIRSSGGILPIGYSPEQWRREMNLRDDKLMLKKRRIVEDSSDDDDSDEASEAKVPTDKGSKPKVKDSAVITNEGKEDRRESAAVQQSANGLRVSLKETKTAEVSPKHDRSVREIKKQMGVDVVGLEAARDGLEAEETNASRAAAVIDGGQDFLSNQESHLTIEKAMRDQKRLMRHYLRSMLAQDDPDEEVWDARELCREASMVAGNCLLWSDLADETTEHRTCALEEAVKYFATAKKLIVEQQDLQRRMSRRAANEGSENSRFERRNLILLLGNARVNEGIANVKLSEQPGVQRKVHLREALVEFEEALKCAAMVQSMSEKDKLEGSSPAETLYDILQATQLKSLVFRWKGTALWYQGGQREASFRAFRQGASAFSTGDHHCVQDTRNGDLYRAEIEARVACYSSWICLADLAWDSLESEASHKLKKSEENFTRSESALEGAARLSEALFDRVKSVSAQGMLEDFAERYDVLDPEDLLREKSIRRQVWERRTASKSQAILQTGQNDAPLLPRSDVAADSSTWRQDDTRAPLRLTLREGPRRRPRDRPRARGYSNIGPSASSGRMEGGAAAGTAAARRQEPRKFRKWGDELLEQTTNEAGESVPKLTYPSVAPEMPPEILAIVNRQQKVIASGG